MVEEMPTKWKKSFRNGITLIPSAIDRITTFYMTKTTMERPKSSWEWSYNDLTLECSLKMTTKEL
jgi:hypothetical protein